MGAVDWPTQGSRAWGAPRDGHRHNGVDFAGVEGAPVYAATDGVLRYVTLAPTQGFTGYGRVVVLEAPDGTHQLYGHLREPRRREGETVRAGDVLGTVGRTQYAANDPTDSRSTMGPHLHFEASPAPYPQSSDAPRLDPLAYLVERGAFHPTGGVRLPKNAPALSSSPLPRPSSSSSSPASTWTPAPATAAARAAPWGLVFGLVAGGLLALSLRR